MFLTDITYLHYKNGQTAYLSCVKDVATHEIVAHDVSMSLSIDIVYRTLEKLEEALREYTHPEALIHSDQGFHYTHPTFQKRLREMKLKQSMSRRGNCLDNAPMESFFGHFKDELDYKHIIEFEELKSLVNHYIDEYNTTRYQWNLEKMTPEQYRNHLFAA